MPAFSTHCPHRLGDVVFPNDLRELTPEQHIATAAMFDAIEMNHPVLLQYALANGALINARVNHAGKPNDDAFSALKSALVPRFDSNNDLDNGYNERFNDVIGHLLTHGAVDFKALHYVPKTPNGSGTVIRNRLEDACLNALLNEKRGSKEFEMIDWSDHFHGIPKTIRASQLDRPLTSWLYLAVQKRRADVVEHWFEQGGSISGSGLGAYYSPMAKVVTLSSSQPRGADDSRIIAAVVQAWTVAPDDLFRQEAFHAAVSVQQNRELIRSWKGLPDENTSNPQGLDALQEKLLSVMVERGFDGIPNDQEKEALVKLDKGASLTELMVDLERRVLSNTAAATSFAPLSTDRPRSRL